MPILNSNIVKSDEKLLTELRSVFTEEIPPYLAELVAAFYRLKVNCEPLIADCGIEGEWYSVFGRDDKMQSKTFKSFLFADDKAERERNLRKWLKEISADEDFVP